MAVHHAHWCRLWWRTSGRARHVPTGSRGWAWPESQCGAHACLAQTGTQGSRHFSGPVCRSDAWKLLKQPVARCAHRLGAGVWQLGQHKRQAGGLHLLAVGARERAAGGWAACQELLPAKLADWRKHKHAGHQGRVAVRAPTRRWRGRSRGAPMPSRRRRIARLPATGGQQLHSLLNRAVPFAALLPWLSSPNQRALPHAGHPDGGGNAGASCHYSVGPHQRRLLLPSPRKRRKASTVQYHGEKRSCERARSCSGNRRKAAKRWAAMHKERRRPPPLAAAGSTTVAARNSSMRRLAAGLPFDEDSAQETHNVAATVKAKALSFGHGILPW